MNPLRMLVVQSDPSISSSMVSILQTLGYRVEQAENDREAARMLERSHYDGVICITHPDDPDVIELHHFIQRKFPRVGFIVQLLKPSESFESRAIREGVMAVVQPPMTTSSLKPVLNHLREKQQNHQFTAQASVTHEKESKRASCVIPGDTSFLVGHDPALKKTMEMAVNVLDIDTPVLILGDRGTGKTALARWIHHHGPRSAGSMVEINCQNSSETALEAEIFGILTTGPNGVPLQKPGKLEEANNGTVVFDEPQNLSPNLQQKVLRFLQSGEYQPIGSQQTLKSNARPLFTTREAISSLVQRDRFRQDLYYRISVIALKLPPLCLRGNDIVLLARHFLSIYGRRLSKPVSEISQDAMGVLCDHGWPGNVYELESVIHRGVILSQNGVIKPSQLVMMPSINQPSARSLTTTSKLNGPMIKPLKESLAEPEKQLILQALEALNWNRQETARVLDINRTTLYKKMKKYNLLTEEDHAEGLIDIA